MQNSELSSQWETKVYPEGKTDKVDSTVSTLNIPGSDICREICSLPGLNDIMPAFQTDSTDSDANTISIIWHELISPLTVIKGYTATLLQLSDTISQEQEKEYLRGIDSASNRVIRLLENLREVANIEKPHPLESEWISLYDLVQQSVTETQNQTRAHKIKLVAKFPLPMIKANPDKLEIVISNILRNAIKYSPEGGEIEVTIRYVRSLTEARRTYGVTPEIRLPSVILSISDAGIGIPENELGKIFDKLYRVKSQQKKMIPGSGLGLYICRKIMEAHGGYIWARNNQDRGSVFHVAFPVSK